jgi:hypothetical protein
MKEKLLANRLKVTPDEAIEIRERYLASLPAVSRFYEEAIEECRKSGYSYTVCGRRRFLPEILAQGDSDRWKAERQAVNNQIQGCLPAQTKILTRDGYVPIGDAPDEGEVWTGTSWAKYTRLDRGVWQLAELELSNGQVLLCDTRHEVLVLEDRDYLFKKWSELKVGDAVCLSLTTPLRFAKQVTTIDYEQGVPVPPLYATRRVVRTEALNTKETTYTLAVQDDLHRFDSEGIISKNTAADAAKIAMINCYNADLESAYGCKMLLQIHDELVFECPAETARMATAEIQDHMTDPFPSKLEVALTASGGIGLNWCAAKEGH